MERMEPEMLMRLLSPLTFLPFLTEVCPAASQRGPWQDFWGRGGLLVTRSAYTGRCLIGHVLNEFPSFPDNIRHPFKFELQINNEYFFGVSVFPRSQILHGTTYLLNPATQLLCPTSKCLIRIRENTCMLKWFSTLYLTFGLEWIYQGYWLELWETHLQGRHPPTYSKMLMVCHGMPP